MFYKRFFKRLITRETKQCFSCKKELKLTKFSHDYRKYKRESDKNRCKVCLDCCEKLARKNSFVYKFNAVINDFWTIPLDNDLEIKNYFKYERRKARGPY